MDNPFQELLSQLLSIKEDLSELKEDLRSGTSVEKKFYNISEASTKLCVSRITLYRQVKCNSIPYKKIGTRIMIPGSFVDKN